MKHTMKKKMKTIGNILVEIKSNPLDRYVTVISVHGFATCSISSVTVLN